MTTQNDNKGWKLFLDDYRNPSECAFYMHTRIGTDNLEYLKEDWVIARNYEDFKRIIADKGLPDIISFDHDLADAHYSMNWEGGEEDQNTKEKTGTDCAKWLAHYCIQNGFDIPRYFIHSMNPIGTERIANILKTYVAIQLSGEPPPAIEDPDILSEMGTSDELQRREVPSSGKNEVRMDDLGLQTDQTTS